ncbi:hypothetical protein J2S00_003810 [Caldalkalibacillus uzonensis]|uniref:Aspartyl-phosphate phosphatase Spo0E family protein n=1 Tax=Caldalkalibacillus uzonensis TaxID=353224 RepID=A0ABU0CXT5_9BACI|nr:aspartyl-phosphate phosphatase Spo0E family protein [Caldalkalibacillus uzonensis]MDQ0340970.1 hypothetical protein [Caldalkalibacillus uzonensis]
MIHIVENRIERLREEMVLLAAKKGLTDPEVIAISQEIDELHNIWNSLTNQTRTSGHAYTSSDSRPANKLIRDFPFNPLYWRAASNQ